ncbi:hypothetical protein M0R45_015615 [Rubus argutus]|uniref:TF-B3 domain-containing protein n=1 Tax=Rubus argutus TaxID=59490 RepID=A0AAW1XQB3_RUBAR
MLQKIPMKFRRMHLHKDKASRAILRLEEHPNISWKVGVRHDEGEIFLKIGWEKFVDDNIDGSIMGLKLTYEGNMTFSVARYEIFGSRMLGLPNNAIRKRKVQAEFSNLHNTFLRYVTEGHNTEKMVTSNTAEVVRL